MLIHLAAVFLGSFLLFQVQPLIGKQILPWFGGTPAVWTTCMLFFQVMLLAGYGYAHLLTGMSRRRQWVIHLVLLAAALLFLPLAPSQAVWKPHPGDSPFAGITLLLLVNIGIPYLVLAATAPLLQHWFVSRFPGRSPYRLYALSNAASLIALLSYPILIEPLLPLRTQQSLWSWCFALFAVICGTAGFQSEGASPDMTDAAGPGHEQAEPPSVSTMLLWLFLSACGSTLLLATTNQICQEVAVVPFLWVLPLALYLTTFIICFNKRKGYDRVLWGMLMAAAVFAACRTLYLGIHAGLLLQLIVFLAALFVCCMVCHGELVRSRPAPRHLTGYYLIMSAGGALGGLFAGIAAPLLFTGLWEYPLILAGTCLLVFTVWYFDGVFDRSRLWLLVLVLGGEIILAVFTVKYFVLYNPKAVAVSRNFYGILRVIREQGSSGEKTALMHGRVTHGFQFTDPARRHLPTTYYGRDSAAGLALELHPARGESGQGKLKAGIIGLGAGTLAAYGRPGDQFRFYEINPEVVRMAAEHFTFLKDSRAVSEIVPGDARITMERELASGSQQYDILLVDAFSSDAIPVHLLSRECFELYRKHLKSNGLLLVHITNKFLDLAPVVAAQAEAAGMRAALMESDGRPEYGTGKARWMILDSGGFIDMPEVKSRLTAFPLPSSQEMLWTDDYASLWRVVRR